MISRKNFAGSISGIPPWLRTKKSLLEVISVCTRRSYFFPVNKGDLCSLHDECAVATYSWWLSVVRELQDVDHVRAFLLEDVFPADCGDVA